ncbi:D-amino-acid transaminase [Desulforhopalus sp. IMCC35007]|uniref:D-amino-acid transaminase n=1 Tax=Desulforhopalus sp. IMCC35007 TaxID=2569543 RepID=UPI0010AE777A|nr:D-amino-acid transaminase [Desulforhopalus sp. IMCC35007]TKB10683.1 D-amino-acid transaminase [Desulforhopalus sp. IMCC35007]
MNRIVYVNGEYLPEENAKISVFDRGFLFADGVYEVAAILQGQLIDNEQHMNRLRRSLKELNMPSPADDATIEAIQKELIRINHVDEGVVYLQVTRGAADRDFAFPENSAPSLVLFTQAKDIINLPAARTGITIVTTEDIRWGRRDIKTVALLAASMAKMFAIRSGADDAWLVDRNGYITEGCSSNAYIVTQDGTIITRQLSNEILHGITRNAVLQLADKEGLRFVEQPFTVEDACQAQEAFVTAAGIFVLPVITINNKVLGNGTPGPISTRLRSIYIDMALKQV